MRPPLSFSTAAPKTFPYSSSTAWMVGVVIFITKVLSCACATPHVSANTPAAAVAASCFCAKFTSSSLPDQVFYRSRVVTDGINIVQFAVAGLGRRSLSSADEHLCWLEPTARLVRRYEPCEAHREALPQAWPCKEKPARKTLQRLTPSRNFPGTMSFASPRAGRRRDKFDRHDELAEGLARCRGGDEGQDERRPDAAPFYGDPGRRHGNH